MSTEPLVVGFTDQARDDVPRMMAATLAQLERSYRRNLLLFGVLGVLMLVTAALSSSGGTPRLAFGVLGVVLLALAVLRVWSRRRHRGADPEPLGDIAFVVDDRQIQLYAQPYAEASDPVETFPLGDVTAEVVPAGPSGKSSAMLPERLVITGPAQRTWQFYTSWLDVPAARVVTKINRG